MSLQSDVERGARAKQLLEDPLISEAFESVRNAIHERWEVTPLRDTQGAHELHLMLKLLGDVRTVFETAVDDGKMAAEELKRLNRNVISPKEFFGR